MSHLPLAPALRIPGLALLALALVSSAARAQVEVAGEAPARLQGVVVHESTFEPIPDALVTVVGEDLEARTGSLGQFAISEVPEGTIWVRVTVPGIPSVRERVEVTGDEIIFLQFRMPEEVTAFLDEVLVDVAGSDDPVVAEAGTALDILEAKVPGFATGLSGDVGDTNGMVRLRGFNTLTQDGNPIFVIDGVLSHGAVPLEVLSRIPATDVESITLLRGPSAAFRYPFAANGVIQITTKRR